jgi:hypothetical protein
MHARALRKAALMLQPKNKKASELIADRSARPRFACCEVAGVQKPHHIATCCATRHNHAALQRVPPASLSRSAANSLTFWAAASGSTFLVFCPCPILATGRPGLLLCQGGGARQAARRLLQIILRSAATGAPAGVLDDVRPLSANMSLCLAPPRAPMRDFYGCYLLQSKCPDTKGRTYIG